MSSNTEDVVESFAFNFPPEEDYLIDPEVFLPFGWEMDLAIQKIQEAAESGAYCSPSWAKFKGGKYNTRPARKQRKLDNPAPGPTPSQSTAQMNGGGDDSDSEITWASATDNPAEPTSTDNTSEGEEPSATWAFSRLAQGSHFEFEPTAGPSVHLPTWSSCMFHSAFFPFPSSRDEDETTSPCVGDDSSCAPNVPRKRRGSHSEEEDNLSCPRSGSSENGQAIYDVGGDGAGDEMNWWDENAGIFEAWPGGGPLSRECPSPQMLPAARRLSAQINLQAWTLTNVLNQKGTRPRRNPDLASKNRGKERYVWHIDGSHTVLPPRPPSPPAHRPSAWQTVPPWSYVYRVAGLRYPKVLADQIEISENKKDFIRDRMEDARLKKEMRKRKAIAVMKIKAEEERRAEEKKEKIAREMKLFEETLLSLRALFLGEYEQEDEKKEEE